LIDLFLTLLAEKLGGQQWPRIDVLGSMILLFSLSFLHYHETGMDLGLFELCSISLAPLPSAEVSNNKAHVKAEAAV
jgi:hypothetical protein